MKPHCASQRRIALASMESNTGLRSPGDDEMTCRTSEAATWRARASLNSRESLAISASAPAALAARRRAGLAAALVAVFPFAVTFFVRLGELRRPESVPVRRLLLGDRPMALP